MPKSREKVLSKAENASPFSQLTYLLHLVTAINVNDNLQSQASFYEDSDDKGKVFASDESFSHSCNVTVLDSVVGILVQQHEVVAAGYTSDSVVVMETDPNPPTDDDSNVLVESLPPGPHTLYPLQIAADFEARRSVIYFPGSHVA